MSHRRRWQGFTLVELLVVIAIIGALVALLLPAMTRARVQARAVTCQSNLRQWATAAISHAHQNNGYLPRRGQGVQMVSVIDRPADWFNALPPLMKQPGYADRYAAGAPPRGDDGSVWSCPEFAVTQPHPHQFAYAMNMKLSPWNAITPDKINRIGPPTVLVFMTDARGAYASVLPAASAGYNPDARHARRVNVAFLDGHVASFSGSEIGVNVGAIERADLSWTPRNPSWSGPGQ